jgi:uncharacterized protein
MRLPTTGGPAAIDQPLAIRMIRRGIDAGVNYVDTAWPYHGGMSETVVGKALRDGYRDRVKIATKLPVWLVSTTADCDRIFDEQCAKLHTDRIDCYLLHALGRKSWDKVKRLGVLDWAARQKERGRIGCIGFSFHDEASAFQEIVDGWDQWTFCQIQYNYMNQTTQAGTAGLELAAARGLAVVIMEPLLGGSLANPPPVIREIWSGAAHTRSAAEWALQWLWDKPEVSVVLSGMTAMDQVEENLAIVDRSRVGMLTAKDVELVSRVAELYTSLRPVPCTQCNYCMPCPSGLDIPRNLELYNSTVMYGWTHTARHSYLFMKEAERASSCTECLQCEEKCPQQIVVHEWMKKLAAQMAAK